MCEIASDDGGMCVKCIEKRYSLGNVCMDCPEGCLNCSHGHFGQVECTDCYTEDGFYMNKFGLCVNNQSI